MGYTGGSSYGSEPPSGQGRYPLGSDDALMTTITGGRINPLDVVYPNPLTSNADKRVGCNPPKYYLRRKSETTQPVVGRNQIPIQIEPPSFVGSSKSLGSYFPATIFAVSPKGGGCHLSPPHADILLLAKTRQLGTNFWSEMYDWERGFFFFGQSLLASRQNQVPLSLPARSLRPCGRHELTESLIDIETPTFLGTSRIEREGSFSRLVNLSVRSNPPPHSASVWLCPFTSGVVRLWKGGRSGPTSQKRGGSTGAWVG